MQSSWQTIEQDAAETALLTTARAIAAFCAEHAAESDRDGAYPEREMARIAGTGLLGFPLPRVAGGAGLGCEPGTGRPLLRLLTVLGMGNLSVARLYEGHVNALLLVNEFGTPAQRARAARDAHAGCLFAVWNTQAADGVRIDPDGSGGFVLTGTKTFASGAGFVDRPLITAAWPDGGWQMVLLDEEQRPLADQSGWTPLGMKASASGRADFTGLRLDRERLVGAPGDYYRQPWFGAGAIRFVAAQFGGALALVDAARAELRAAGRTEDDAQRYRAATMLAGIEAGLLLLDRAGELADRSGFGGASAPTVDDRELLAYVNLCRGAIERVCLDAIEFAQRSAGARALIAPHPIERLCRDLAMYLRQPAPDAAARDAGGYGLAWAGSLLDAWGRGE